MTLDRNTTKFGKEYVYIISETADAWEYREALEIVDSHAAEYQTVVLDFARRRVLELADYGFVLRLCDHIRKKGLGIRFINCNTVIRDKLLKLNFDRFSSID